MSEHPFYDRDIDTRLTGVLFRCCHKLPSMVEENSSQRRVLGLIDHGEDFNQKQLAELMGIRQPSMSELLSKLENKGFITRQREPGSHMMHIRITDSGRTELEKREQHHNQIKKELFLSLSDEDKEQLYLLMNTLLTSWDN